jgi:hypothetical protein
MVANRQSINVLLKRQKLIIYIFVKWNPTICNEKMYRWTSEIVFIIIRG